MLTCQYQVPSLGKLDSLQVPHLVSDTFLPAENGVSSLYLEQCADMEGKLSQVQFGTRDI